MITEEVTEYPDGNLKEIFTLMDGLRQGPCVVWYPNGQKWEERTYVAGKLEGPYRCFYEDGTIEIECTYKGDVKCGEFRRWHPNGQKWEEGYFKDPESVPPTVGNEDGPYVSYYPNGSIDVQCRYRDGKLVGTFRSYYESGGLEVEYTCGDHGEDGLYRRYYEDRSPWITVEYRAGTLIRVISVQDPLGRETVLPAGEIEVWRAGKVTAPGQRPRNVYIQMVVPREARRVTVFDTDKRYRSRVEYAFVIDIVDHEGRRYSEAGPYVVGQEVRATSFNADPSVRKGEEIEVCRYKEHCVLSFD